MTECEQCGRCCRYIILPFHKGAKFDALLCLYRNIRFHENNMIVPCRCFHLVATGQASMPFYCLIHEGADYPTECRLQKAGGWGCNLLHAVFP